MRTIEIDFDVHKCIEMAREGFHDTPNSVLRRLLKLTDPAPVSSPETAASPPASRGWRGEGVHLPHGTLVRMKYNGQAHEGRIDGESWLVDGRRFDSPSGAAVGVARTKAGKRTHLDGWNYWDAKLPASDQWISLNALRARAKSDV